MSLDELAKQLHDKATHGCAGARYRDLMGIMGAARAA